MKINGFILLFSTLILGLLGACQPEESNANKEIKILCTTGIIADAVENLVQGHAQVNHLMGPGVDPHLYKASQADVMAMQSADIIVYNGLHLEGKMTEILEKTGKSKPVYALGHYLDSAALIIPDGELVDPHIWLDLSLWAQGIQGLSEDLSAHFPGKEKEILLNSESYTKKILDLDEWVVEKMENLPKENRILITSHDAFGYFGKRYGVEVKGLQGISTAAEYGLRDLTNLVDFCIENKVRAVFVESSVNEKSLKAVVEGAVASGYDLKIGGKLYSDALGQKEGPAGNYLGMVRENVETIYSGLE